MEILDESDIIFSSEYIFFSSIFLKRNVTRLVVFKENMVLCNLKTFFLVSFPNN